jgi:hypothetical protein
MHIVYDLSTSLLQKRRSLFLPATTVFGRLHRNGARSRVEQRIDPRADCKELSRRFGQLLISISRRPPVLPGGRRPAIAKRFAKGNSNVLNACSDDAGRGGRPTPNEAVTWAHSGVHREAVPHISTYRVFHTNEPLNPGGSGRPRVSLPIAIARSAR